MAKIMNDSYVDSHKSRKQIQNNVNVEKFNQDTTFTNRLCRFKL